MPGPPPKPNGQKRNRTPSPGFRRLPIEGRKGTPPRWPIGSATDDEIAVWTEAWEKPQAVEWERLGWTRTVARYVRILVEAEQPGADTTLRSEARQLEDRLGLTPMAMMRLRWETEEPEEADERPKPATQRRPAAVDPAEAD